MSDFKYITQDKLSVIGEFTDGSLFYALKDEDGSFKPFLNDCNQCKHFRTDSAMSPDGLCSYNKYASCGYGKTCKRFECKAWITEQYGEMDNWDFEEEE